MRIGLVCPYPWDVPGGVQAHVADCAEVLAERGHQVSVLAPAQDAAALPPHVSGAGRSVPVPYNGSVSRLTLGPLSNHRVRRWLREGDFDVLHVHEPAAPSVALLASYAARVPMVATFHASAARSRWYTASWSLLAPAFEKMDARIAVSDEARRTLVERVGVDALVVPNGVHVQRFADAQPLPPGPAGAGRPGEEVVGFLGRLDEPRKGLPVLLDALETLVASRPGLRLLVAGPGDLGAALAGRPAALTDRVVGLGRVSEEDKARFFASCRVYVAPNTGGESFGIVLLESFSAGTPLLASDLDGFRDVAGGPGAARLFARGDPAALASALLELLDEEPGARAQRVAAGRRRAQGYDWSVVVERLEAVYEAVRAQHAVQDGAGRS